MATNFDYTILQLHKPPVIDHEGISQELHTCHEQTCAAQMPRASMHSCIVGLRVADLNSHKWAYLYCKVDHDSKCSHASCSHANHWTCSHEHAVDASHWCIDNHFHEPKAFEFLDNSLEPYIQQIEQYTCCLCGNPFQGKAYSMVVDYATHGGTANRNATCENDHWACSFEHAQYAVHVCLHQHVVPEYQKAVQEKLEQAKGD